MFENFEIFFQEKKIEQQNRDFSRIFFLSKKCLEKNLEYFEHFLIFFREKLKNYISPRKNIFSKKSFDFFFEKSPTLGELISKMEKYFLVGFFFVTGIGW